MRRVAALALFILLLIPSTWFAWRNRDMPQFGRAHDHAIYFVAAKSLGDGHGYRIRALRNPIPERPGHSVSIRRWYLSTDSVTGSPASVQRAAVVSREHNS